MCRKTMKPLKVSLIATLTLFSVIGVLTAAFIVPTLFTQNWVWTAVNSNNIDGISKGSLVLSEPRSVENIETGNLIVLSVNTSAPRVGKLIDYEKSGDIFTVRSYGSTDESDIISYNTKNDVNTIFFTLPLIGYLLIILSSPFSVALYVTLAFITALLYRKLFFTKQPKPVFVEPVKENSFQLLQQIFDETPPKLTRKEKRQQRKTDKLETKKKNVNK